jgi:hypothetical protein
MKAAVVLAVVLSLVPATAQLIYPQPVMTNSAVEAMLRGGAALNTIIQAIKTATNVDFLINNHEAFQLIEAGASDRVSDQILEAMHQRVIHGPAGSAATPIASLAPIPTLRATRPTQPIAPQTRTSASMAISRQIILEDATPVRLRLSRRLSSSDAAKDDTIDFEVLEDVKVGQQIVIQKGSLAWGTVTNAEHRKQLARGGKLDINIDTVRLADGVRAPLRGVKQLKGSGHTGAMTTGIVLTSLVAWPAAPLFLFMHGNDITVPEGTEITAYISGNITLDSSKFSSDPLLTVDSSNPGGDPMSAPAIAAPPEPIELPMAEPPPPPPPPAEPPTAKTISLGEHADQVIALIGQPVRIVRLGTKEIYLYNDLKVTFNDGIVSDVE